MTRIKDLPILERPREKAIRFGIEKVSTVDLLAIIIGSGTKNKSALDIAYDLVNKSMGLTNLINVNLENLTQQVGLSDVGALRILSCFELCKRILNNNGNDVFKNFKEAIKFFGEKYRHILKNEQKENVYFVGFNSRKSILREKLLYIGTCFGSPLDIKEVLEEAFSSRCKSFILIHNHPGNCSVPSDDDVVSTMKLKEISRKFNLVFVEHIIVTGDDYIQLINHEKIDNENSL